MGVSKAGRSDMATRLPGMEKWRTWNKMVQKYPKNHIPILSTHILKKEG